MPKSEEAPTPKQIITPHLIEEFCRNAALGEVTRQIVVKEFHGWWTTTTLPDFWFYQANGYLVVVVRFENGDEPASMWLCHKPEHTLLFSNGFEPLDRSRYWTSTFGPPTDNAEARYIEDLRRPQFRLQRQALQALTLFPRPVSDLADQGVAEEVVTDLADVGLALPGLDLARRQRTFRLSRLGAIILEDLGKNRPSDR